MPDFPKGLGSDSEAVSDALDVGLTQWQRGERGEALRWLRKAIDAAFDDGDDARGVELSKAASTLAALPAAAPPPPVTSAAPPPPPPRPPPPPTAPPPKPAETVVSKPAVFPPPPEPGTSLSMPPVPAVVAALGRSLRAPGIPPPTGSVKPPSRVPPPGDATVMARPPSRSSVPPGAMGGRRNTRSGRRNSRVPPEMLRGNEDETVMASTRASAGEGDDETEVFDLKRTTVPKESQRASVAPTMVLTQSVRVAVGAGPSVRLLGPRDGLFTGEAEAWLVATSPASDLVAILQGAKKSGG